MFNSCIIIFMFFITACNCFAQFLRLVRGLNLPFLLSLRCQVAHIVLNLDDKLHYHKILLRAKMAACGLERLPSFWGVVFTERVS